MLLPDNIHPDLSIYYNGSILLMELKIKEKQKIIDLYQNVKNRVDMSFPIFILCLDWLYLIDAAKIDENGCVELCS
ncbi:hypothetical protein C7380_1164 [Oceanotoga teriensis]|uniref:Uncharacterized protein n=1 Tax=Oceanotoga teriensis TaxID=515440 RepID=A0AA45C5H8_9BACT|nr:ABC-three component system middle component 6 [Oceanotoga teriensis]PWJ88991.1 hypothetical protein C7380_1164 [Oceanotoga teriensis]